jgi:hypothetical protein
LTAGNDCQPIVRAVAYGALESHILSWPIVAGSYSRQEEASMLNPLRWIQVPRAIVVVVGVLVAGGSAEPLVARTVRPGSARLQRCFT